MVMDLDLLLGHEENWSDGDDELTFGMVHNVKPMTPRAEQETS